MRLAILAALALSARVAAAESIVATGEAPPLPRSVDGRVGMLLGGASVGNADGFSVGFSAAGGYRIGDVTLRGMFDYYRIGDPSDAAMPRRGRGTRLGGAARYSFANNGHDAGFLVDLWGELGLGYEHDAWLAGGVLDRPSAEGAIGIDVGGRTEPGRGNRPRAVGYFMAFRTLVGEGPPVAGAMATCGGPCTRATTPPRTDVSTFFELGVHFGR